MKKKEKIPKYFYNLRIVATRPQTVQRDEFVGLIWTTGAKMRGASIPYKSGSRAIYFEKNDIQKRYQSIVRRILRDYKGHLKHYEKITASLHAASKAVEMTAILPDKEKVQALKKWMAASVNYYIPVIAPFAIEEIIDNQCRELLRKEFGARAKKLFEIISSPSKLNTYQKMRMEIINLALNKTGDAKQLKQMAGKYGWYGEYSYIEPLLDEKYFRSEIKKISREKALKERNRILKVERSKKNFQSLKRKIRNKKLKLLATVLNDYTFIRTERIEHLKRAQARIRPLFKAIVSELEEMLPNKWRYSDVVNFTNRELIDFLEKRKVPDAEEIKKRVSHNYVYYYDTKAHFIYGVKLIKKIQQAIHNSGSKERKIKGVVAQAGKIQGKVVIVHNKTDLKRIKRGTVLVARFTMPDYTCAMKKASAFVTEEGGITSHAAIIARELKKPCIVNTGNCMRILKDGQLVEVDAHSGVVRILKS